MGVSEAGHTDRQSGPRTSREYEKPLYKNPNTRVTEQLVGDTGTMEKNSVIKKVQTYQNVITTKNLDTSRKTFGKKPGKKSQRTTRTKITIRNDIISKMTNHEEKDFYMQKKTKNKPQTM